MALRNPFDYVEISLANQRSRLQRDAENAARTATVEITQQTTGAGQFRIARALYFPVVFRGEPHFVCGSGVVKGLDPNLYHDPRGTSGVTAWVRNTDGLYTGAKMWVHVEIDQIDPSAELDSTALRQLTVLHYYTFTGVGIKNLPTEHLDATLPPLAIGQP